MEARHVEIERFARKAAGYKKALDLAPHARDLELAAVVSFVLGICRDRGWAPKDVRVVDLMAGNGILSLALKGAGFGSTRALEACAEMIPDGKKSVEFIDGEAFTNLRSSLADLRPQIIVSLAGFHHLIERTGKRIDRLRSVASQALVAGACVESLCPGGVLLVVDVAEDEEFGKIGLESIREWDATAFRSIAWNGSLGAELMRTRDRADYEEVLSRQFGELTQDGTLKWFREFVDPRTVIGHDDMAIGSPLLQILKWRYRDAVRVARFRCPWLFDSQEQAVQFVLQKFGFYVDRAAAEVDSAGVLEGMKRYLGFSERKDGRCVLAWSLVAWSVTAKESGTVTGLRRTMTLLLFLFSLIMFLRTALNAVVGVDSGGDDILSRAMWLVVGIIAARGVDSVRAHLD